jgi:uncharacterized membrane protein
MDDNPNKPDAGQTISGRGLIVVAAVLTLVALIVSGYLSAQTLTGSAVAGCGADDSCGAVLASPWSNVAGLPVSLLGAATYLAVLLGLGLRLGSKGTNTIGDFLLLATAPAMLIAAIWFTYLQLSVIEAICPYCMVDHGIGVVLGIMLPMIALGKTRLKPAAPLAIGAIGCIAVIGLQHITLAEDTQSTANPFVDRDGDQVIDGKRYVSMFGGELQFVLEETPHIGDPSAKQVVGVIFDYACPHCRETHTLIEKAFKADPKAFVFVPLPISINDKHNPYLNSDNDRFNESYELALKAQAVAAVDMDKWREFDRWLFSEESSGAFPRSAADAQAKAIELVGEESLLAQYDNDAKNLASVIDRNIELLALIPEEKRYIPVITSPGATRHLTERFYEIDVLKKLLEEAAAGLTESKE